jgi:predicted metal-dependent hydrolase
MPAHRDSFSLVSVETARGPLLVPYEVRRSARARRIRVSIGRHNQALLLVPTRGSLREALGFLRSQGDWLERHLRSAPAPMPLDHYLSRHPHLSGLGREFTVALGFTTARPFLVFSEAAGEAAFRFPAGEEKERALKTLLRQFAVQVLPKRVQELAAKFGLRTGRVTVRDQGTRWGSCSAPGGISLNWRLVLLPAALHDYVILHELAHLTEMNHSDAYWNLLRTYDPRAILHDRQLTRASRGLMRLGRE